MKNLFRLSVAFMIMAVVLATTRHYAIAADSAGNMPILTETSPWRILPVWRPPVVRTEQGLEEFKKETPSVRSTFIAYSDLPSVKWVSSDFDDSHWERFSLLPSPKGKERDYGFRQNGGFSPAMAVQCLRGKFKVADPAKVKNLKLSLVYRGGVVVYLNGKEIARAHLQDDKSSGLLTLAEEYPVEVFIKPDKSPIRATSNDPNKFKEQLEKRIRRLENIEIRNTDLQSGVNVLALEFHRAPYMGNGLVRESLNLISVWSTCGLINANLQADAGVESAVDRPSGIQVWNSSVMERTAPNEFSSPYETLKSIKIPAAKNGTFSGKIVVSSDKALQNVSATISSWTAKNGKDVLPAEIGKIFYVVRDDLGLGHYREPLGMYDTLTETAPAEVVVGGKNSGAIVPVWLKVRVPADARVGEYQATLTVTAKDLPPTKVPVELNVADWRLPDSRDFTGAHLGLIQSPDTLAAEYNVPLWSEQHWVLIERSMQLLGELSNRYAVVPLIARTNFGNEQSMVRYVNENGNLKPEFTVFDRYLDLVQKYMNIDVLNLYVWDRYTGQTRWAGIGDLPATNVIVTVVDPATGKGTDYQSPVYSTPEAKIFWEPVYKEMRERLKKRGLLQCAVFGTSGDAYVPHKEIADLFKELWPGARFISGAHADRRGSKLHDMPYGYNTTVYVNIFPTPTEQGWGNNRNRDWKRKTRADLFPRAGGPVTGLPLHANQHISMYRLTLEAALNAGYSGLGRMGLDFWPVPAIASARGGTKHSSSLAARYPETCWDQLNLDRATETLTTPGPNGALTTQRYENLREGMQECEARVFIEKVLDNPAQRAKLGAPLAKKMEDMIEERMWLLRGVCSSWNSFLSADTEEMRNKLFQGAAEVAATLRK